MLDNMARYYFFNIYLFILLSALIFGIEICLVIGMVFWVLLLIYTVILFE
jgi:hypothetical protein